MSKSHFLIGYDIQLDRGPVPRPKEIQLWTDKKSFQKRKPHEPFKYFADALLGLSAQWLQNWAQPVKAEFPMNWQVLDPHFEIYNKSHHRILALRKQLPSSDSAMLSKFENSFSETVRHAFASEKVDLSDLYPVIEAIDYLEDHGKAPLLFNFSCQFSPDFTEKLQVLYSLLWNLRSLVAIDHNAHISDASHEALRVDSITDYLPKSEYIVNDALLYFQVKKLSEPFIVGKNSDVRIEKLLVSPIQKAFQQYSHNASYLIDHLPMPFLKSLSPADLEEALYLVQMDWLLASEAGLLYKIREELFGLQNGYEKIFWPEWSQAPAKKELQLHVSCELSPEHLRKGKAA